MGDAAPMNEQIQILAEVARRLDGAGLPYMLTGSMALTFYAQPRFTRDVDLVLELGAADVSRFVALFTEDFECDEDMVREAIRYQKLFNLIHVESVLKFDFILRKSTEYRREEFQRRRRIPVGGVELSVVSPEDLLLSKLLWGKDSHSEVQRRDVRNLLDSQTRLDWDYLERWAKELGVLGDLVKVKP
jgi:predicted nucleotidyltransferase